MALKNPNKFPQFAVFVWTEHQKPDGEWEPNCSCVDRFDNEDDARTLFNSIGLRDGILEVDLEMDTELDTRPLRHKDEAGEYDYAINEYVN